VSRTLLLIGARSGGGALFAPVWSEQVEAEADRHARTGQVAVSVLRASRPASASLVPAAPTAAAEALVDTDPKDRHVAAAAAQAGATVIVTRNVRHFGIADLAVLRLSAAHPDLFLRAVLRADNYRDTLELMAATRARPPNTPAAIHAAIGRDHPRLFAAMSPLYPAVAPTPGRHAPPTESFRGVRCLSCGNLYDPAALPDGLCDQCQRRVTS
jgi:hypothetical protein